MSPPPSEASSDCRSPPPGEASSDCRRNYLLLCCFRIYLGVVRNGIYLSGTPKEIPKDIIAEPIEWRKEGFRFFKIDRHDGYLHIVAVGNMVLDLAHLEFGTSFYSEEFANDARYSISRPPFVHKRSPQNMPSYEKFMEEITKEARLQIVEAKKSDPLIDWTYDYEDLDIKFDSEEEEDIEEEEMEMDSLNAWREDIEEERNKLAKIDITEDRDAQYMQKMHSTCKEDIEEEEEIDCLYLPIEEDEEDEEDEEMKGMSFLDRLDIQLRTYCVKLKETAMLSEIQYEELLKDCRSGSCPHCAEVGEVEDNGSLMQGEIYAY